MDTVEFIKERDQKSLFLLLFLPCITSIIASFSSTAWGLILVFIPKEVEETILKTIFESVDDDRLFILLIAFFNIIVDLFFLFCYFIQKTKFEIRIWKTIQAVFLGHTIAGGLYLFSLVDQNTQAYVHVLVRVILATSMYFVFVRFFPKKYLEILMPYSTVFVSREIQTLSNPNSFYNNAGLFRASKKRLQLYVGALSLYLIKSYSEKEVVGLIDRWKLINQSNEKMIVKVINDFSSYLLSKFEISVRSTNLITPKLEQAGLLRKFISLLDNLLSWSLYSSAISHDFIDLVEKTRIHSSSNGLHKILNYTNKDITKLIKFHLKQAAQLDGSSNKQKIYAVIIIGFVYLISPTLIYLIASETNGNLFIDYRYIILLAQYLLVGGITVSSVELIKSKYNNNEMENFVSNKYIGYLVNITIVLIVAVPLIANDLTVGKLLATSIMENLSPFLTGVVLVQAILLILFVKPPSELKKPSLATSLLVRELLFLRSYVSSFQNIRNRRQIGRHVYFSKKYFSFIAKSLVNSRFDSSDQRVRLQSYFNNINEHLDHLSYAVKVGTMNNRGNIIAQIDALVYLVAIEEFGEIPKIIPEIKSYLDGKAVKLSAPSRVRQFFQILDTSWFARALLFTVIAILINLINPSLWEFIQNFSSLFGIFQ